MGLGHRVLEFATIVLAQHGFVRVCIFKVLVTIR